MRGGGGGGGKYLRDNFYGPNGANVNDKSHFEWNAAQVKMSHKATTL